MARRKRHEEPENHERWLVSYADFITLLFAFFVVLYATSNRNEDKEREFQESIRRFMAVFAGSGGAGGSGVGPQAGISSGAIVETIDPLRQRRQGNPELQKQVAAFLKSAMLPKELESLIQQVRSDASGVRIVLSASAFFPPGSAKLRLPALVALDKVAEILRRTPYRVVVEGHTDDSPVVGGGFDTNWELAGARASSVVRYLIKVRQVSARKLSAASYADQKPVAANDTEANRAKNRRIEVLISTREEVEDAD